MKLKLDRIISLATLAASLVAIFLVLKKPAPVAQKQSPASIAANAQSFDRKMEKLESAEQQPAAQASPAREAVQSSNGGNYAAAPSEPAAQPSLEAASPSGSKAEVHVNSDEISAVLAQALGAAGGGAAAAGELSPDSNIGSGAPTIKDQQVSMEGDVVHGQFLTEIAGKDVWITVSGHLGSKDGYATFDPTEFKVGDLNVPVSLINPALQKKLAEQRDRLKLPDNVGDVKVQGGELVMQQK
ncbi:MAG TPA: hypothetical protein VMF10_01170 [Candidatus Aquilonibacter sp.]|nr:hypothetical protein [Candidatus Aquilonibacter sp.]